MQQVLIILDRSARNTAKHTKFCIGLLGGLYIINNNNIENKQMINDIIKAFNKYYVLRITSMHIKKAIDNSIRKTYNRLSNATNKQEVFETLDVLHKIRKLMEDFESANKHLYNNIENKKENK